MIKRILKYFPGLPIKLRTARIQDTPDYYIKKTMITSVLLGIALTVIVFSFIKSAAALYTLLLLPLLFAYFLHYADMRIIKRDKEANQELVYAVRFLIIELESGVPLYNTFQNIAKNYEHVGQYFQEIVDKVNLGTSMEGALEDAIEYMPSEGLRKILWQILNSLRTGSEIINTLGVVVDQIVREQKIAVVEYGRKLNPMAMFYMMIAIILPSLGTTMLIVMATFIGFRLSLPILLLGSLLLMFVQFLFLAAIRSQRPAVVFS